MGKRGRPVKKCPRGKQYRLRMTQDEEELYYLSSELNLPKSEIIRKGIECLHNMNKNGISIK